MIEENLALANRFQDKRKWMETTEKMFPKI